MNNAIYLDYAATTPMDPRVIEKVVECLGIEGNFGNPASRSHGYGWMAEAAVEMARGQVAKLIGASPREIVWTSGATEADNLAIKGVVLPLLGQRKCHVITTSIEHKAVLDPCKYLESLGVEVTYLKPNAQGVVTVAQVEEAITADTVLVSVMHVNNEIGSINPISEIGAVCRKHEVLFHVDAAQSVGKLAVDVNDMNIDLLSMSAHKIYGPKGIGALFVRKSVESQVEAQILGGGHERGLRSGTLPTHQIVGFGEAAHLARTEYTSDMAHAEKLRNVFLEIIKAVEGIHLNGDLAHRIPFNLNVSIDGVEGETLLIALKDIAVSSGSACNSASVDPSYVLTEIGVPAKRALSSVRLSFGRFATEEEVKRAAQSFAEVVTRLRG